MINLVYFVIAIKSFSRLNKKIFLKRIIIYNIILCKMLKSIQWFITSAKNI